MGKLLSETLKLKNDSEKKKKSDSRVQFCLNEIKVKEKKKKKHSFKLNIRGKCMGHRQLLGSKPSSPRFRNRRYGRAGNVKGVLGVLRQFYNSS